MIPEALKSDDYKMTNRNETAETKALRRAISIVGSQTALAKVIGSTQGHVWNWLNRDNSVSVTHVLAIEAATKGAVTRYQLRPDVYGHVPAESDSNE